MPIYHIYNGKDKVASINGDMLDILESNSIIYDSKQGHRDSRLAVIPNTYLIIIEEMTEKVNQSLDQDRQKYMTTYSKVEKLYPDEDDSPMIRITELVHKATGDRIFQGNVVGCIYSYIEASTIEDIKRELKKWYAQTYLFGRIK